MGKLIHGHEVMEMMIKSEKKFTKESLERAIIEQFGEDARFFTCSADNMTAKELIDFLETRNKFENFDEGFTTGKDKICNH